MLSENGMIKNLLHLGLHLEPNIQDCPSPNVAGKVCGYDQLLCDSPGKGTDPSCADKEAGCPVVCAEIAPWLTWNSLMVEESEPKTFKGISLLSLRDPAGANSSHEMS